MTDDLSSLEFDTALANNLLPNIQTELIDKGTTFTNFFVTNPSCCPSRATYLTGQYSHNHGVLSNEHGILFFDDSSTLATWLQDDGYYTGHIGKYLNGYGKKCCKTEFPFSYVPVGWDEWYVIKNNIKFNDNGIVQRFDSPVFLTDKLGERSVEFIQDSAQRDEPFFLSINTRAPKSSRTTFSCELTVEEKTFRLNSTPVNEKYDGSADFISQPQSPSFNEEDISDKPNNVKARPILTTEQIDCIERVFRDKLESMRSVDDLVGSLIQAISDANELDDTIIIFTSDNGYLLGEHRLVKKGWVYEESIGVPLVIRTLQTQPQVIDRIVLNNDLAPTISAFAGVTPELAVDGRSLVELIDDPDMKWRKGFLIQHSDAFYAVRQTGTHSEYLYFEKRGGFIEFYELTKDPYQLENKSDCTNTKCQNRQTAMSSWLANLKECNNGSCQKIERQKPSLRM